VGKRAGIYILFLGIFLTLAIFFLFSILFRKGGKIISYDLLSIITLVDYAGIVLSYLISCFTISALVVGYIRRYDIKRWFFRSRFVATGESFPIDEEGVEAVVIPVSRMEQPSWILRWFKPKAAALIYTEKTKFIAERLRERFNHVDFVPTDIIKNPDDPSETKEEVKLCISRFKSKGIPLQKIFVDTTGGKVPMSIGAFLAAEEEGVSTIYLVGGKTDRYGNKIIKDPDNPKDGYPIFISDRSTP